MFLTSGREIGQKTGRETHAQTTSEQNTEHPRIVAERAKNGVKRTLQECEVTPFRTPDSFNLTLSHCCNPLDSRNLR
jgi:hypothetical protein